MTQRFHKVLLDKTRNQFTAHPMLSDVNQAAKKVKPNWKLYTDVCLEGWELYPKPDGNGGYEMWVLRANLRCSCAGPCAYHADHDAAGTSGYAQVPTVEPGPDGPLSTEHGAAMGYVEAKLALSDLSALAASAKAKVADSTLRTALAASLAQDAATLNFTADEIEGALGVAAENDEELLSAKGAVAQVLAGTSTNANDYFCVMAFIRLYQRAVARAHQVLSKVWPSENRGKPIRYGARNTQ